MGWYAGCRMPDAGCRMPDAGGYPRRGGQVYILNKNE